MIVLPFARTLLGKTRSWLLPIGAADRDCWGMHQPVHNLIVRNITVILFLFFSNNNFVCL